MPCNCKEKKDQTKLITEIERSHALLKTKIIHLQLCLESAEKRAHSAELEIQRLINRSSSRTSMS